jgi:hypothetical protein
MGGHPGLGALGHRAQFHGPSLLDAEMLPLSAPRCTPMHNGVHADHLTERGPGRAPCIAIHDAPVLEPAVFDANVADLRITRRSR